MQGCMAGKSGEVTPEKLWEKAKELEKKDVGQEERKGQVVDVIKVEHVKTLAKKYWDSLDFYKDTLLTIYEVHETFPTIFFL